MDLRFLLFLVSGAVIGFGAGWLFSALLFRPVVSRSFMGFSFQGFIPARKTLFSGQIVSLVTNEFFSGNMVSDIMTRPENFTKLMPVIEIHIDDFLRNRLKTAIPMIGMMIGDRTISQLKSVFMNELETILPIVISEHLKGVGTEKAIASAIKEKLLAIPPQQIENALRPSTNKILCGAGLVIGLVTGLINLLIALILFL